MMTKRKQMRQQSNELNEDFSLEAFRGGLSNFIGNFISVLPQEGVVKNRIIISLLIEEVLKVSQIEPNTPCNLEILKPLFDGADIALRQNLKYFASHNSLENAEEMFKIQELRTKMESFMTKKRQK